jgi:hypothetical protein
MQKLSIPKKMFEKIEVHWEDSVLDRGGWCNLCEYDFEAHVEAIQYITTGFFIKKQENALFICQSIRDDGEMCAIMSIPFTAIKSIRRI